MHSFIALYTYLLATSKTADKAAALVAYFRAAPPADAAWALFLLSGRKLGAFVKSALLRAWVAEQAQLPDWLLDDSRGVTGDLAEAIALLYDATRDESAAPASSDESLAHWLEDRLLPLRGAGESMQRAAVLEAWSVLDADGRFVWNRLLLGSLRGITQPLLTRALADAHGIDAATIAHRLAGDWQPTAEFYAELLGSDTRDADISRPYPFCLPAPLDGELDALGDITDWQIEWQWEGTRAQLVRREGQTFLWSQRDELLDAPSLELPDGTVLDGVWRAARDDVAATFLTFDLLEDARADVRTEPLKQRRKQLEALVAASPREPVQLTPLLPIESWDDAAALWSDARDHGATGVLLKRRESAYIAGRTDDWLAWPVAPYTVRAVLMYAQRGIGRYASLYSDYTFGVWDGDTLVPIVKQPTGLGDAEIRRVDAFVRRNVVERFGPVRTVRPELVFELAFEGAEASSRHKSGLTLRHPRVVRRTDVAAENADTLASVRGLLIENR